MAENNGDQAAFPNWGEVKDGAIDVPDELMPLMNKVGMQMRFHTMCGKSEVEACAHIVWQAQKFFHANPNALLAELSKKEETQNKEA